MRHIRRIATDSAGLIFLKHIVEEEIDCSYVLPFIAVVLKICLPVSSLVLGVRIDVRHYVCGVVAIDSVAPVLMARQNFGIAAVAISLKVAFIVEILFRGDRGQWFLVKIVITGDKCEAR